MPLHLKTAPTKTFADTAQQDVAERVRGIIGDIRENGDVAVRRYACLLYTSPSPRDLSTSRMPSSA